MRNISRNAIAKRHENLLIVGWQVYERARNECASDVTRTRYAHSASIGQTVAHTRLWGAAQIKVSRDNRRHWL